MGRQALFPAPQNPSRCPLSARQGGSAVQGTCVVSSDPGLESGPFFCVAVDLGEITMSLASVSSSVNGNNSTCLTGIVSLKSGGAQHSATKLDGMVLFRGFIIL